MTSRIPAAATLCLALLAPAATQAQAQGSPERCKRAGVGLYYKIALDADGNGGGSAGPASLRPVKVPDIAFAFKAADGDMRAQGKTSNPGPAKLALEGMSCGMEPALGKIKGALAADVRFEGQTKIEERTVWVCSLPTESPRAVPEYFLSSTESCRGADEIVFKFDFDSGRREGGPLPPSPAGLSRPGNPPPPLPPVIKKR